MLFRSVWSGPLSHSILLVYAVAMREHSLGACPGEGSIERKHEIFGSIGLARYHCNLSLYSVAIWAQGVSRPMKVAPEYRNCLLVPRNAHLSL